MVMSQTLTQVDPERSRKQQLKLEIVKITLVLTEEFLPPKWHLLAQSEQGKY